MTPHQRRPGPAPGGGHFAVVDPATGEVFDEAPDQRAEELDVVVGRAHEARSGRRADPAARARALLASADAVEAADATRFGPGGSVWGADLDRAAAVADRLECGTVWINHRAELSPAQPFAGTEENGVGVAGGPWGLHGNLRPFVVSPSEGD